jgi:hypothetical protein
MSLFFDDINDNISFGVQSSNIPEVANFSSRIDDVYLRLFTNNNGPEGIDNLRTGSAIGSSNYDKSPEASNILYFGNITNYNNLDKVLVIQQNRVGINTLSPTANFQIYGGSNTTPTLFEVNYSNSASNNYSPAITIAQNGAIGMGTSAIANNTLTVYGVLQADSLIIGNGSLSGGNSSLITAQGIQSPSTGIGTQSPYLQFANNSFCNITNIVLNSNEGTLYTNFISSTSPPSIPINFNASSLTNISNLTIAGDFSVRGSYIIQDTVTTTTDQFIINNSGTGPGLVVNQNGFENIVEFKDDCNVVMYIKDGGQTVFGNFGSNIPNNLSIPSLVYIVNPSTSNQDGLSISQLNPSYNTLSLSGSSTASCNIIFTSAGEIGIGTNNPNARIQITHQDAVTTPFIRLSVPGSNSAFVIGPDGHVGIGTDPSTSTNALVVNGTIQATNIILGGGSSSGDNNLITAYGIVAPNGTNYLGFGGMDFSNVNTIKSSRILLTNYGSAEAPGYSFESNHATGMFAPSLCNLAFSTNSNERIRIDSNGNIGINTSIPSYTLDVNGTFNVTSGGEQKLTINSTGISTVSINTQNNAINIGSGTLNVGVITASNIHAKSITSTTINTQNNAIYMGSGTLYATTIIASNISVSNITSTSINTQNNLINAGSGSITAGIITASNIISHSIDTQNNTINTGTGAIHVGIITSSNIHAKSITSTSINTQNNAINIGSGSLNVGLITASNITTNTINTQNAAIYVGTIYSTSINTQNNSINVGSGTLDVGLITASNITTRTINTQNSAIYVGPIFSTSINTQNNSINTGIGTITAGTISVSNITSYSINTQNNTINAGSGTITAGTISVSNITSYSINTQNNTINAGSGSLTVGIITSSNINAGSSTLIVGAITSTSINTQNNNVNIGSGTLNVSGINASTINVGTGSLIVGNISSGAINTQNNPINTGTGSITVATITTQNNNINVGSGIIYANRVLSSTYVGIGTTNPQSNLDVWGTGHFTDSVLLDNSLTVSKGITGLVLTAIQPSITNLSNVTILGTSTSPLTIGNFSTTTVIAGNLSATISQYSSTQSNLYNLPNVTAIGTSTSPLILGNTNTTTQVNGLLAATLSPTVSTQTNISNLPSVTSIGSGVNSLSIGNASTTTSINGLLAATLSVSSSNQTNITSLSNVTTIATNVSSIQIGSSSTVASLSTAFNVTSTQFTTPSGNIGIGTDTARSRLDVLDGDIILNNGNLGIGTLTPLQPFHVVGQVYITSNIGIGTSTPRQQLDVVGQAIFNNNVGIGTTIPLLPLHVGGNAAFGNQVTVSRAGRPLNLISDNATMRVWRVAPVGQDPAVELIYGYSNNPNDQGNFYWDFYLKSSDGSFNIRDRSYGIGNKQRLTIASNGYVGIGTSHPRAQLDIEGVNSIFSCNVGIGMTLPQYSLDVNGIINAPTIQVSILSNIDTSTINFAQNTLSNINLLSKVTTLDISTLINSQHPTSNINASRITLSNLTNIQTSALQTSTLSPLIGTNINLLQNNLSNVNSTQTQSLQVNTISSQNAHTSNINFNTSTLTNITQAQITQLITPSIASPSSTISFNYNKILDVDSLIVRSNISVLFTGLNTYSNLPIDLVRIDQTTGKILDSLITSNIVRLMNDGTINSALLPIVPSNRSTLLRTNDKMGLGTRTPAQKFHVNAGNACITGGRLGIGTTIPLSSLHIWDYNASASTSVLIQSLGSTDILQIYGSNNIPVLNISSTCNIGIRNSSPLYSLDVTGKIHATDAIRVNAIESDNGMIDCRQTTLSNIQNAYIRYLTVTSNLTLPSVISASTTSETIYTNTITASTNTNINVTSALRISGYDTSLNPGGYVTIGNIDSTFNGYVGIKVDYALFARNVLTPSDRRIKTNIVIASSSNDLKKLLKIPVYNYKLIDGKRQTQGFIAQEVESILPDAINTIRYAIPSILRYAERIPWQPHSMYIKNSGLRQNDIIKVIINNNEYELTVNHVDENILLFTDNIPMSKPDKAGKIFIYGHIVNDFKVIEHEKLFPLICNSIKELNAKIESQDETLRSIYERLVKLEHKN